MAAQIRRAPPEVVRELAYLACSAAVHQAKEPNLVTDALVRWHDGLADAGPRSEIAALAAQWDGRYFDLVEEGADQREWMPFFRSARAGSAVLFATQGDLMDAIYEAVHAVKGVVDLAEVLRARLTAI